MKVTENSQNQTLSKEAFAKVTLNASELDIITRPVIGYWTDAILRLSRNKVAMLSLLIIVSVGFSGLIGPILFPPPVDGVEYQNLQNTDSRNQPPTLGDRLLVTEDYPSAPEDTFSNDISPDTPLLEASQLPKVQNFSFVEPATVNGIQLTWTPIAGASGYKIYRAVGSSLAAELKSMELNEVAADQNLRGYEVGVVGEANRTNFVDSSGLDPSEFYVYSIVPFVISQTTGEEIEGPLAAAVKVNIQRTIALSKAQEIDPEASVGGFVQSRAHYFGTDSLGRDIFSRMMFGTRIDFFLALLVPTLSLLFGLTYGAVSGLVGGKVDLVLMRIIEIIDSLPELLLFVLLQVALGKGVLSLIIALSAFSWTSYARILRGEVLRLREIEFVHASRLLGASFPNLIFKHIAPNLLGVMIVLWSGHIPRIITAEAFLSIIGLGVESPMATWGTVLQEAGERFQVSPLQFFLPASVMGITLLAFFLLGDALRDAFDPKLRGRE